MKFIFIFTVAVIVATSQAQWTQFKTKYHKMYKTDIDEQNHLKTFLENKRKIAEHNKLFESGKVSYELEVNKFTDLSEEERRSFTKGLKEDNNTQINAERLYKPPSNFKLSETLDWRTKGAVTPVKDQDRCAACWAFSVVGTLEGQYYLKTKNLVSLSEQNLLDCSDSQSDCTGGFVRTAYDYIKSNSGINTEKSYPYESVKRECRYDPAHLGATLTGYVNIKRNSEADLQIATAEIGPISVLIGANYPEFFSYKSGVYDNPNCSSTKYDHAVTVIGYGTENGKDYWLVKNSWGADWGEKGYIKMSRNKDNQCAIAAFATYPLV